MYSSKASPVLPFCKSFSARSTRRAISARSIRFVGSGMREMGKVRSNPSEILGGGSRSGNEDGYCNDY